MEKDKIDTTPALVVIGGSAGSLQAIFAILAGLDKTVNPTILVVLHRGINADSALEELLASKTHLQVKEVEEKEQLKKGYLYICPADYHVLIEADFSFSLDASEKVNYSRPSLDVVFESVADLYKENLTAILLSGASADGVAGLYQVRQKGGTTIVQDPADAVVAYMPEQALKHFQPDHVLTAAAIGNYLSRAAY